MHLEVIDADFGDPAHCAGIFDVLDSYAGDAVGG
jgi:hypothetical protein